MSNKKFLICLIVLIVGVMSVILFSYFIYSADKYLKKETFLEQFSKSGIQYSDKVGNYVNSEEYKETVDRKNKEIKREKSMYIMLDLVSIAVVIGDIVFLKKVIN